MGTLCPKPRKALKVSSNLMKKEQKNQVELHLIQSEEPKVGVILEVLKGMSYDYAKEVLRCVKYRVKSKLLLT